MSRIVKFRVELVKESSKTYDVSKTINSSSSAPAIIRAMYDLDSWHNEKMGLMCLDVQNRVVGVHIVSEGTVNETAVFVREIATRSLLNNAVSVILFHNHPGGSTQESHQDVVMTRKVKEGLGILNIKLLDHFIMTEDKHKSFAEGGLL